MIRDDLFLFTDFGDITPGMLMADEQYLYFSSVNSLDGYSVSWLYRDFLYDE